MKVAQKMPNYMRACCLQIIPQLAIIKKNTFLDLKLKEKELDI